MCILEVKVCEKNKILNIYNIVIYFINLINKSLNVDKIIVF